MKQRHHPDKPANNRPPRCPQYEEFPDRPPICVAWFIDNPKCHGQRHSCMKVQMQDAAARKGRG